MLYVGTKDVAIRQGKGGTIDDESKRGGINELV